MGSDGPVSGDHFVAMVEGRMRRVLETTWRYGFGGDGGGSFGFAERRREEDRSSSFGTSSATSPFVREGRPRFLGGPSSRVSDSPSPVLDGLFPFFTLAPFVDLFCASSGGKSCNDRRPFRRALSSLGASS